MIQKKTIIFIILIILLAVGVATANQYIKKRSTDEQCGQLPPARTNTDMEAGPAIGWEDCPESNPSCRAIIQATVEGLEKKDCPIPPSLKEKYMQIKGEE